MRAPRYTGVAALLAAFTAAPLWSQSPWQAIAGAGYEIYSFGDADKAGVESLSLLVLPFGVRAPLAAASLEVTGAYARGELVGADGLTRTLSGPTDTRITLETPVAGPLRIAVVGLVPTGVSDLSEDEALVAGAVAADLLPFRITHWGSGGGLGLSSTLAHSYERFGFAASATYMKSREFDALEEGGAAYRPGDHLRLQLATEADVTLSSRLSLLLSYQSSGDDRLGGANLYRAGDRYQAVAGYSFSMGSRGSALAYGGWLHRSEGAHLLEVRDDAAPAEDLLLFGGNLRLPVGRGVVAPGSDLRLYRNEAGLGQGYTATAGLSLEWPVTGAVLIPQLRGRLGRVQIREAQESGFTGVDLGLSVRFRGRNR